MSITPYQSFLVRFTEHVTYEMEIKATSDEAALGFACELLAGARRTGFVPVETEHTDLTVISLEPTALNLPQRVPTAMASGSRAASARPVTTTDVAVIVKLLEEVRDTTLSHGSWEEAKRLIRQFAE